MSMTDDFQRQYREAIGKFATGVTIIVAAKGGEARCMTANALTSLSLDPTLLIFCPAKKARISELCEIGTSFTVNILGREQEGISNHFAGADTEPEHEFVAWPEAGEAPRIAGSVASIACTVHAKHEGGDHWIIVGEVVAMSAADEPREPLLFFSGGYRRLASDSS